MIVYDVKCKNGHVFTAWFKSSESFDAQAAAGEIACVECGVLEVARAPMAPRLISSRGRAASAEPVEAPAAPAAVPAPAAAPPPVAAVHAEAAILQQLRALRHTIEQSCDYVGKEFAEEARKMHHGESDRRGIYGEATESETEALADEGIEIGRVPWVSHKDH